MLTTIADSVDIAVPARPTYRFAGTEPPAALAHLRHERVWCVWDHQFKRQRWTKPPCSWRDGCRASITDQKNWCTFEEALTAVRRFNLAGIGLVLEAAGYSGIDLDHCITDSGSYLPVAAEAISLGETYGEVSPSGTGIHLLVQGAAGATIKRDDLGIELYERGRYFTVTGDRIDDLPAKIGPAPMLIEYLRRVDAATPRPGQEKNSSRAKLADSDFFANVKTAALANLDAWVPVLHPTARKYPNGAWRIAPEDMGRNGLEEDLSYHANGIREFGLESKLTPIDAVMRYGPAVSDATEAAMWLCRQMRAEPTSLGWQPPSNKEKTRTGATTASVHGAATETIDQAIDDADAVAEMLAEICDGIDNDPIPPRQRLLGWTFCKEFFGGLAGPGGTGKTALRLAQCLSVAIGRPLTDEMVFRRAKVLAIGLEDSRDEYRRRQRACALHHEIEAEETKGWFRWLTVTKQGGKIVAIGPKGNIMPGTLAGVIEAAIAKFGIELVHFDPFVKAHGLPENDNRLIDEVMTIITGIAARHGVAMDATFHTPKGPSDPGNADKFRGASSQRDALRLGKTLTTMSPEEAERFGISERERRYFIRYDDAKVNISPYDATSWFKLVSVPIGNGDETYPDGDHVQTVEPWSPPDAWKGMTGTITNRILDKIDAGMPDGERYSAASAARTRAAWRVVADIAGKKEGPSREIIKGWLNSGLLKEEPYTSPKKREEVMGLRVDDAKRPSRGVPE